MMTMSNAVRAMCGRCGKLHFGPVDCFGVHHVGSSRSWNTRGEEWREEWREEHRERLVDLDRSSGVRGDAREEQDCSIPSWWKPKAIVTAMRAQGTSVNEISTMLNIPTEDVWEMTTLTSDRLLALEQQEERRRRDEFLRNSTWCPACAKPTKFTIDSFICDAGQRGSPVELWVDVAVRLTCSACAKVLAHAAVQKTERPNDELSRHVRNHSIAVRPVYYVQRRARPGNVACPRFRVELVVLCSCCFEHRFSYVGHFDMVGS